MLCMLPPGPTAPPVIEDIADAAAIHSAQQTRIFDAARMLGPAALTAGLAAGALTSGLALYAWHRGHMLIAQIGLTVIALAFIAATVGLRRAGRVTESGLVGVAAAAPLGLALAAALPGTGRRTPHSAGRRRGGGWSLLLLTLTDKWVAR